jgi:hypothetical protein
MRRLLAALFAVAVLATFAVGFGATPAIADGPPTITPFRGDENVYRAVDGTGFRANVPVRLYVSSPAREPLHEVPNNGLTTGADGSLAFSILPAGGFGYSPLTHGVWQFRVCVGMECYDFNVFIGGHSHVIPTGMPARICTPFITPYRDFPTFGPPGEAIDPRTGFTFNQIVQYCGPYATPWIEVNQFLVPGDWYPGYTLPYFWPYQTIYPWDPAQFPWNPGIWGTLPQYNCIYAACGYPGYSGPLVPMQGIQTSGYGPIMP